VETPSNAQQSGIGIVSTIGFRSLVATVIGAFSIFRSGIVMSGCVFFICTVGAGLPGGSGRIVMRAVSFFGPGEGLVEEGGMGVIGGVTVPIVATAGADGLLAVRDNRGVKGGEGDGAAVSDVRGGNIVGREGGAVGGGEAMPFAGGRVGKLILTVSRGSMAADGAGGAGGKVIRTVSFFGSGESAIRCRNYCQPFAGKRPVCHSPNPTPKKKFYGVEHRAAASSTAQRAVPTSSSRPLDRSRDWR
jgi:hypothetical protein